MRVFGIASVSSDVQEGETDIELGADIFSAGALDVRVDLTEE
jgi:hypothetical protein